MTDFDRDSFGDDTSRGLLRALVCLGVALVLFVFLDLWVASQFTSFYAVVGSGIVTGSALFFGTGWLGLRQRSEAVSDHNNDPHFRRKVAINLVLHVLLVPLLWFYISTIKKGFNGTEGIGYTIWSGMIIGFIIGDFLTGALGVLPRFIEFIRKQGSS